MIPLYGHTTSSYDSYGLILCELVRHLARLGIGAEALPTDGRRARLDQDDEVRGLMQRQVEPVTGGVCLAYPTAYPTYGPLVACGPQVALTMVESTLLPVGWSDILNSMDQVLVPSQFCQNVFQEGGITVPLRVCPLGVSEAFEYRPRTAEPPFSVLAFMDAHQTGRKGWDIALQAFQLAFEDDPDYRLILKAREGRSGPGEIRGSNVGFLRRDLSLPGLVALYQRCDVLLAPSRCEGFGLPQREFARTGGLTLATRWSGTADDLSRWGMAIDTFNLVPARTGQGEWAEVDVEALAAQLRGVAALSVEARNAFGRKASEFVSNAYRWETVAEHVALAWAEATLRHAEHSYERVIYG